jgi:hypothetical protein
MLIEAAEVFGVLGCMSDRMLYVAWATFVFEKNVSPSLHMLIEAAKVLGVFGLYE